MTEAEIFGVIRWCDGTITVGKLRMCLATLVKFEFARARRLHPENSAFAMRPLFYTGSPFGREILELARVGAMMEVGDPV